MAQDGAIYPWCLKRIITPYHRDVIFYTYEDEENREEKQAQSLDAILDNSFNNYELNEDKSEIITYHNPENINYFSQVFVAKQMSKKIIRPKILKKISCSNGAVELLYTNEKVDNCKRISSLLIYGVDKKNIQKLIHFDYDLIKNSVKEPLYPNLSESGGYLNSLIEDNKSRSYFDGVRYFLNQISEVDKTQKDTIRLCSFKYHNPSQLPEFCSQFQNHHGFYINYPNFKSQFYIGKDSKYYRLLALDPQSSKKNKKPNVDQDARYFKIKDTTVVNGILTSMQNATGAVTKFVYDATFEGAILKHTCIFDGDKKIGNTDFFYQDASIPLGNNCRKYTVGINKFGITPWGRSEASLTQGAPQGFGTVITNTNGIKSKFEFTTASDYDNTNNKYSTVLKESVKSVNLFVNGNSYDYSNIEKTINKLRSINGDFIIDKINNDWVKVVGDEDSEKLKKTILYAKFFAKHFNEQKMNVYRNIEITYKKDLVSVLTDNVGRPTERDQLRGVLQKKETFNLNGDPLGVEEYDYSSIILSSYDTQTPPFIVSESYTEASDEQYIVPYSLDYEILRLNGIKSTSNISDKEQIKKSTSFEKYSEIHPLLPEIRLEENLNTGEKWRTVIGFKVFTSTNSNSTTKAVPKNQNKNDDIDYDPDDDGGNGGSSNKAYPKYKPYPKYLTQKQVVFKNGQQLSGSKVIYNHDTRLPNQTQTWINGEYETTMIYDRFDSKGRILEAHGRDGILTAYRYKGNFMDLSVHNASFDVIKNGKAEDLRKNLKNATIESATYSDEGYLLNQTDANGYTTHHEYDNFGRLKLLRDHDKNVVEAYDYQYGKVGQIKSSTEKLGIGQMVLGDNFVVGGYAETKTKGLPSSGKNYIATYAFRKEGALFQERNKSAKAFKSIEYQDGLGRPIQQIALHSLPGEYSLVKGFEYDSLGRQPIQYRSLPMLTNDSYKASWKSYLKDAYKTSYKAESLYDAYNRLSKQGSLGENYAVNKHASSYNYGMNQLSIPSYAIDLKSKDFTRKDYPKRTLLKTTVYFEGITHVTYKNMDGQLIRKAAVKGKSTSDPNYESALITDYVYDDYGNLRAILPPQAKGDINQDKFVYRFHYDGRNRLIKKEIPGAGSILFEYDKLDRPIKETDALGNTTYVKYDKLSRPIETGILLSKKTTKEKTEEMALQKSHYDNYDFDFAKAHPASFSNAIMNKGRSTGSETKVLGEEIWVKSVNYYDKEGRLIEVISQNNTGGIDKIKNEFDFEGKILNSHLTKNYRAKEWTIEREYSYGKTGELIDVSHRIGKNRKVILNSFTYKPEGAILEKRMHNGRIKTRYEYDELDRMIKTSTEKHFSLELAFDSNLDGTKNTPYYDGSISAMAWQTAGQDRLTYSFDYDDYKNLKAATSTDHAYTANYSYNKNGNIEQLQRFDTLGLFQSFSYEYEKSNQLKSLKRNNTEQVEVWPGDANNNATVDVDDLLDVGYNYQIKVRPRDTRSDQWMAWWVNRRKGDNSVFSDSNGDGIINEADTLAINQNLLKTHPIAKIRKDNTFSYRYDANGNMTSDEYKNIDIHYNHLNLPDTITAHGQGKIINVYLADGSLLQRKVLDTEDKEIDWLDYQGEFLFKKDKLSKIITEEGYVSPSKTNKKKLTYYYVVSDHLGHSRVVLDEKENVVQTTAYYPYGLPIAELSSETKYNYLYTGKEFIDKFGLNWYDHHARNYDAEIGRWSSIDPALQAASPYMAMGNNPMMMVDTDGEWFWAVLATTAFNWFGSVMNNAINNDMSLGDAIKYSTVSASMNISQNGVSNNYLDEQSMISGVNSANQSLSSQLASFPTPNIKQRALDRGTIPIVSSEPPIFIAAWSYPKGEELFYRTLEQAQRTNAWKQWHRRSSGRVDITDSPIDFVVGSGLLKTICKAVLRRSLAKSVSKMGFTVHPNKFNYFFGRVVAGTKHNIGRSAQNLKDLTTLGVNSEKKLMGVFKKAINKPIISTKTSPYGTTVTHGVSIGKKGSINVGFFYKGGNMSATPSVSSIIPKIY